MELPLDLLLLLLLVAEGDTGITLAESALPHQYHVLCKFKLCTLGTGRRLVSLITASGNPSG